MQKPILTHVLSVAALVVGLLALARTGAGPVHADMLTGSITTQAALGTGFTYQGYLTRSGAAINGQDQCDMRFSLWDAAGAGAQVGNVQTINGVDFTNGTFTVTLNAAGEFGANAFNGQARWLQIDLACPSGSTSFSTIGRQAITAVPYALHSMSTGELQGRAVSAAAPSTGQTLTWDGTVWSPASTYARTVVVSPADTPVASGARLLAAVVATSDSTAEKRYLIKIEPGIYDIRTATLQMRTYVDIEGSGQGVTRLVGQHQTDDVTGLINTQGNAELRQLSVEVTSGSGAFAVGISNNNASPRITDVTVRTDGATSYGIVSRNGASPRIERVTVNATSATGFASGLAHVGGGTLTLVDVVLLAQVAGSGKSAGLHVDRSGGDTPTVIMRGGSIEGGGTSTNERNSIQIVGGATVRLYDVRIKADYVPFRFTNGGTVLVAGSEIDTASGLLSFGEGQPFFTLKCVGSYTSDLTPLNSFCIPS